MHDLRFYLFTRSGYAELGFGSPESQAARDAYHQLMSIFGKLEAGSQTLEVSPVQRSSEDLNTAIAAFVDTYSKIEPRLNRLAKRLRDLTPGSHFLVLPRAPNSTAETLRLETFLTVLDQGYIDEADLAEKFAAALREITGTFAPVLSQYNTFVYEPGARVVLGEPDKAKRVCRFCGKTSARGAKFNKPAHAIPEALGNKDIVQLDECDDCNQEFGNTIEPHLIRFLDLPRVSQGVKGKSGAPVVKYPNATILNHDGLFTILAKRPQAEGGMPTILELGAVAGFVPQAAYKALCKLALSVIRDEYLIGLEDCVEWVSGRKSGVNALPKVASNLFHADTGSPWHLTLYVRKSDSDPTLPHVVGEYRLGVYLYVFVLPYSRKDTKSFADEAFETTFAGFPHYLALPGWKLLDLSMNTGINLAPTLVFNRHDKP